ncbi:LuxR C-terminal-related transcriptional regulator [Devosia sp. ZB163]|uniref:helix-turn-helix transcriptional regulator n=1 Tax=Devosia sp. ZB163 TaxID=3025938 RepID=UPI002361199A|nr:LuxR C-terminal-related transcriptional regulator [Devosia sp. ZB163]MDC9826293.1 LuxR C-terminal-related transcriptional regulator [Devosia sp. ZB163]
MLATPHPIVLLEAWAGMGKSVLLAQLAEELGTSVHCGPSAPLGDGPVILWDIPPGTTPDPLPEIFVSGLRRIVIAKRPETVLPALDRAGVYGHVRRLGTAELLLGSDELLTAMPGRLADRMFQQSRGWPILLGQSDVADGQLSVFLASELLARMEPAELVGLEAWLDGHPVEMSNAELLELVRPALREALVTVMAPQREQPEQAAELAVAYTKLDRLTDAIITWQSIGRLDEAFDAFSAGGGRFYLYRHGAAAFDRVLEGFPLDYALGNDTLVMSLAMQALKHGEVARARRLLADRFGSGVNEVRRVFTSRDLYSTDLVAFRVVMLIYEDYLLTDELFEQVFSTLADLPLADHIVRGSFYNSVLEFYIRGRRLAAAEDVAKRALYHYEQARVPMLSFYISLHQALMRLLMGDATNARQHAEQAERYLHGVEFESPGDERLLTLLNACIDYEGGKPEPLARFLSTDLDDFVHGEIWPSLIEFALHYGSQALSEHFSTIAARNFLDRWRVYQISNRQFGVMIELREAAILQNANRWQEAAEKVAALATRITRAWVAAAGEELERLRDRDEIVQAMIWLRHIVYEQPTRPHLERQLGFIIGNLNLTGRQRLCAEVWLAFVYKRQRNLSRARALLQKVFEEAARLGAIAPLAEERVFLSELIEQQRIGEYLEISAPVRQVLRRLRDGGLPNSALGAQNGLSRRETKVLMMISEGSSNKFIANALGLSEATVKFHLSNAYRKLGCKRRREAISAARALGLVS